MDYYQQLNLPPTASASEIEAAWRIWKTRSERRAELGPGGIWDRHDELDSVFAVLRDPEARRLYDETIGNRRTAHDKLELGGFSGMRKSGLVDLRRVPEPVLETLRRMSGGKYPAFSGLEAESRLLPPLLFFLGVLFYAMSGILLLTSEVDSGFPVFAVVVGLGGALLMRPMAMSMFSKRWRLRSGTFLTPLHLVRISHNTYLEYFWLEDVTQIHLVHFPSERICLESRLTFQFPNQTFEFRLSGKESAKAIVRHVKEQNEATARKRSGGDYFAFRADHVLAGAGDDAEILPWDRRRRTWIEMAIGTAAATILLIVVRAVYAVFS